MISLNKQPVEKRSTREDGFLEVFDVWHTIQGEGPYAGTPAVFVRLSGCNLQCPGCDTDYTSKRKFYNPFELKAEILRVHREATCHYWYTSYPRLVVFTGGEPFRQNFGDTARLLLAVEEPGTENTITIQVETNGTLWQPDMPLVPLKIICSPKTPVIHSEIIPYIHSLKYVVQAGRIDDKGFPTSTLGGPAPWTPFIGRARAGKTFRLQDIYIQPMDEQDPVLNTENIEAAVKVCMKHGYNLSLQLHKWIGVQ